MLLQIFEPLRAKPQQWRCESLRGVPFTIHSAPELEEEYLLLTDR